MNKPWLGGLIQATGLAAYISTVALFMQNAQSWLGRLEDNLSGPILFLSLFSFSALICGLITFFYPVKLFFIDNKKKSAVEVVLYTALFLFLFLMGLLFFVALT